MAKTLTYKILEKHLVAGELAAGEPVGIKIDPNSIMNNLEISQ